MEMMSMINFLHLLSYPFLPNPELALKHKSLSRNVQGLLIFFLKFSIVNLANRAVKNRGRNKN